jgi:hypothetical protein
MHDTHNCWKVGQKAISGQSSRIEKVKQCQQLKGVVTNWLALHTQRVQVHSGTHVASYRCADVAASTEWMWDTKVYTRYKRY